MKVWSAEIKELQNLHESLKGQVPDLEKELDRLVKAEDDIIILLCSRRCLEVIITDLCERELKRPRKTEPLKGIIDKLNKEEKVPSHIITSMQNLNSLSAYGAHPKEFDPEQVRPVLINLSTIIKWYLKYKNIEIESVAEEEEGKDEIKKPEDLEKPVHIQKQKNKSSIVISGILLISIIIILIFDVFNVFNKDKFEDIRDADGRISIAVMPFENQTGDATLNWFQRGISSLIINGLGSSSELAVRDDHTMYEVMESMDQVFTAGISPSQAKKVAEKVRAETYISGSYQGREGKYWILANLVNTESGDIIWTNKVEGDLKSSRYLDLANSLCNEIKNYLEIKVLEQEADFDFREAYTESAEAYRYFIEGMNSILTLDTESAIESLTKALEIDSTFTFASFYIAYAYSYSSQIEQCNIWTQKAYNTKDKLPSDFQHWLELWYACYINKNLPDVIRYCNLLEETGIESRLLWFDLGVTYYDFPEQYEKAVEAFEKVEEISMERGDDWEYELFYVWYGKVLHKIGKHEKESEIYEIGLIIYPKSGDIIFNQTVCAFSCGDTAKANDYLEKWKSIVKESGDSEDVLEYNLGEIYKEANIMDKAEEHYRIAYELNPQEAVTIYSLTHLLIYNDINVDEGMELIQKALDLEPDHRGYLKVKGWGCYKQGKFEEAIQLLRRAEEEYFSYRTELQQQIQEVEKALANQNK